MMTAEIAGKQYEHTRCFDSASKQCERSIRRALRSEVSKVDPKGLPHGREDTADAVVDRTRADKSPRLGFLIFLKHDSDDRLSSSDVAYESIDERFRGCVTFWQAPKVLTPITLARWSTHVEREEGASILLRHPKEQGAAGFVRAPLESP
jgi:hypothetical protein